MSAFTDDELAYLLAERRLARLATVGWAYNEELGTIDIGGHSLEETKKFRDVG